MSTGIWWIRRDLRLHDNQALAAVLNASDQVIPLFILDDHLLSSPRSSSKRTAFLFSGLSRLDSDLRDRGSRLVIRSGEPHAVLSSLISSGAASSIYAEQDYSPYARHRDSRIMSDLPLTLVGSPAIFPPGTIYKRDGTPYTVFTPFSRMWLALPSFEGDTSISAAPFVETPITLSGLQIPDNPTLPPSVPFIAGEQEALRRLQSFTRGDHPPVSLYTENRNRMDLEGTSGLSPYLRFGMLSPRQAVKAVWQTIQSTPETSTRNGAKVWLNELIWRDFYIHILFHFPHVLRRNFRIDNIPWENRTDTFQAWCEGCTGYPVVDAAMRQLTTTGWMHNRARMIVSSFLTKDLLIDWRWGEQFFMQHLLDGDPASNNGGWQWVAGTGTDAAPYFRIFNPVTQGMKYDPHGAFIRKWLPELAHVKDDFVHEPWRMTLDAQREAACIMRKDYPYPIIDHSWARQRALAVYSQAKTR